MVNVFEDECPNEDSSSILTDNTGFPHPNTPEQHGLFDITDNKSDDPYFNLNNVRSNNIDRTIIVHLNINFLYQKFEPLKSLVKSRVDILANSETKLDKSFPIGEFEIEGYSTSIRLDRNCYDGGIILYVRSDIPCKELKSHKLPNNGEVMFTELIIRKIKWLLVVGYNSKKENIAKPFE